MTHNYSGLTAQQVAENRRSFGVNTISAAPKQSFIDKVQQVTTSRLLKGMAIANVVVLFIFLLCDLFTGCVTCASGIILIIFMLLLLFVFIVVYLGGRWNESKERMEINPLITILVVALSCSCLVSYYQDMIIGEEGLYPYFEPLGIALALLLAIGVTSLLERKNDKTFRALQEASDEMLVKVIRDGGMLQVPRKDIVVGDVIVLEPGDEIPADAELLKSTALLVNESSLTGEPECVKSTNRADYDFEAVFQTNHLMRGTIVLEGEAIAQVFAVGDRTELGSTMRRIYVRERVDIPLQQQLNRLARTITYVSYVVASILIIGRIIIYFVNGHLSLAGPMGWFALSKYLLDTIMIAVTLLVVTIPEGLPMAISLSLAFSTKRLMRHNILPRTMHACETIGATTIICTDKTGILTYDQMWVKDSFFAGNVMDNIEFANLLWEGIACNTTANLQHEYSSSPIIGNSTEGALLLWMRLRGHEYTDYRQQSILLDRLPFSKERKYMASIVQSSNGRRVLYVKGAPDVLMHHCKLTKKEREQYDSQLSDYQSHAYRTLGLAYRYLEPDELCWEDGQLCIYNLHMQGVVAIADPLRADVSQSIMDCMHAGIEVMLITGDAPGTACEVARQLGLWRKEDDSKNVLIGLESEYLSDSELRDRLRTVKVVARARSYDKERIVRLLREMGHVVAITGDGTNDAPALAAADVGLSLGDGSAVAIEASDMVIQDNSFTTISNAVQWGRSLYKNIQRFVLFQLIISLVACFMVTIGAFVGNVSPVSVTQMLWVNLIFVPFAALALSSLPPSSDVMHETPRPLHQSILNGLRGYLVCMVITMTTVLLGILVLFMHMDITSLAHVDWRWESETQLTLYESSLFFTIFVMLQFWNLFNVRALNSKDSALYGLSLKQTPWFIIILIIILVGQVLIVEMPILQEMFSVVPGGIFLLDWVIIFFSTSIVFWIGELARYLRLSTLEHRS